MSSFEDQLAAHRVYLIHRYARVAVLPDSGAGDEREELDRLQFKADGHFKLGPPIGETFNRRRHPLPTGSRSSLQIYVSLGCLGIQLLSHRFGITCK